MLPIFFGISELVIRWSSISQGAKNAPKSSDILDFLAFLLKNCATAAQTVLGTSQHRFTEPCHPFRRR